MSTNIQAARERSWAAWEDLDSSPELIAKHVARGRVLFVLGAGISKPLRLPDWGELVERLFKSTGTPHPTHLEPPDAAEHFFDVICKSDRKKYHLAVHDALYSDAGKIDYFFGSRTLTALGALVLESARHKVPEAVTLNFDDVLEEYLEFHGRRPRAMTERLEWSAPADVLIHHPNGLIPRLDGGERKTTEYIVLDKASFGRGYASEEFTTFWTPRLLNLLQTNLCLFLGVSGDDPYLDGLCSRARNEHVALRSGFAAWGVRLGSPAEKNLEQWRRRKVACLSFERTPMNAQEYDLALGERLLEICRMAAEVRRSTF